MLFKIALGPNHSGTSFQVKETNFFTTPEISLPTNLCKDKASNYPSTPWNHFRLWVMAPW